MRLPGFAALLIVVALSNMAASEPASVPGLFGSYFDTIDGSGPRVTRVDPQLAFAWGETAGPIDGVAASTWSARWTGYVIAPASGTVNIATRSDDGIDVWIDRKLVIRNWGDHGTTRDTGTIAMAAGQRYDIIVNYYNNHGSGVTELLWSYGDKPETAIPSDYLVAADLADQVLPPGAGTGFEVTYFDNDAFAGAPIPGGSVAAINGTWGTQAPIAGVTGYRWSSIWRGVLEAPVTDTYTIMTSHTGCLLVYVDGQLVIDRAQRASNVSATCQIPMIAGSRHDIDIRYANPDMSARLSVYWSAASIMPSLLPGNRVFPRAADTTPFLIGSLDARVNPVWIAGQAPRTAALIEARAGEAALTVVRGGSTWYIDDASSVAGLPPGLRLEPQQPRIITVTAQEHSEARTVQWEAIDLANTYGIDPMTIRRGDSLLLTHSGDAGELLELDLNYHDAPLPLDDIATYTACAVENESYELPGICDVAYGAKGGFAYKAAQSGTIAFTNATFGDSIVGVGKMGYYRIVTPFGFQPAVTGLIGDPIPIQFTSAGTFVVKARVGGRLAGSLNVRVVSADLKGPIACEVFYQRFKDVAISHPALVTCGADDSTALVCTTQGTRLTLRPTNGSRSALLARLGTDGPVIARQPIDTFVIESTIKRRTPVDAVYPDGSRLCAAKLIQTPGVPNLEVRMHCFKAGVFFVDGSVNWTVNTTHFTPIPFATTGATWFPYQLILGAGVGGGVCHSFVVYQNNVQISY